MCNEINPLNFIHIELVRFFLFSMETVPICRKTSSDNVWGIYIICLGRPNWAALPCPVKLVACCSISPQCCRAWSLCLTTWSNYARLGPDRLSMPSVPCGMPTDGPPADRSLFQEIFFFFFPIFIMIFDRNVTYKNIQT